MFTIKSDEGIHAASRCKYQIVQCDDGDYETFDDAKAGLLDIIYEEAADLQKVADAFMASARLLERCNSWSDYRKQNEFIAEIGRLNGNDARDGCEVERGAQ